MFEIAGGIIIALVVLTVLAFMFRIFANWLMSGSNAQQNSIDERRKRLQESRTQTSH